MTWTTELPTEPGWYWVKCEDAIIICGIYSGYIDKVLVIENFDYDEVPLASLSSGVQFQPVKQPDEEPPLNLAETPPATLPVYQANPRPETDQA